MVGDVLREKLAPHADLRQEFFVEGRLAAELPLDTEDVEVAIGGYDLPGKVLPKFVEAGLVLRPMEGQLGDPSLIDPRLGRGLGPCVVEHQIREVGEHDRWQRTAEAVSTRLPRRCRGLPDANRRPLGLDEQPRLAVSAQLVVRFATRRLVVFIPRQPDRALHLDFPLALRPAKGIAHIPAERFEQRVQEVGP